MTEDFLERMHMGDQDDDDADLKQLKQLRQVWLDMPEEEPPEHGLSLLMAAARSKAEEMAPRASWLSRVFATLVRPPVLALATVVVVAGGAVLVHNHRDEMVAEETAPPPSPGSAVAEGAARDEGKQKAVPAAEIAPSTGAAGSGDQMLEAPADRIVEKEAKLTSVAKPTHTAKKHSKPERSADDDVVGGDLGRGANGSVVLSQQPKAEAPPPPPPPPPTTTMPAPAKVSTRAPNNAPVIATDEKLDNAEAAHSSSGPGSAPSVSALLQKARDAAQRGDCTTVKQLAEQIAKIDLSYYRSTVATDQTVGKCL